MNWIEQNNADAQMLDRIDLSPLDASKIEGDDPLVASIDSHNRAITDLAARFSKLAEVRLALADADRWSAHDAAIIVAERRRVVAESWDALASLRRLLRDRTELLRRIQAHLGDRINGLAEQMEEALYNARRALERKHRQYVKAQPVHGPAYIAELAENDDTVRALSQQTVHWEDVLRSFESLRLRNGCDTPLTFRQREVFPHLN